MSNIRNSSKAILNYLASLAEEQGSLSYISMTESAIASAFTSDDAVFDEKYAHVCFEYLTGSRFLTELGNDSYTITPAGIDFIDS